jgi:hypothetical protein
VAGETRSEQGVGAFLDTRRSRGLATKRVAGWRSAPDHVTMKFESENFAAEDSDGGFEPLLAYNKLFHHEALIGKLHIFSCTYKFSCCECFKQIAFFHKLLPVSNLNAN